MTCKAAMQHDTIWLESRDYEVVPLNEKLASRVAELKGALRQGVPAYADNSREGFYDVELKNGSSYICVRDDARTIYLVAFSAN